MLLSKVQICVSHILSTILRLLFLYLFFFSRYLQNKTDTTHNTLLILLSIQCFLRLQFQHYFLQFFLQLQTQFPCKLQFETGFPLAYTYIYKYFARDAKLREGKYAVNVTVCAIVVIIKKRFTIYSKNDMIVPDGCFSCTYKVKS